MEQNIRATYIIWLREFKRFFREPSRIIGALGRPLFWLLILGGGLTTIVRGSGYQQFIFPGVLGMTIIFTTIFSAISIIWDRQFGFMKEMLVAPISRTAIVGGKILGGSTEAMMQGGVILLIAPFWGVPLTLAKMGLTLLVMFYISVGLTALGICIAASMETFEGFNVIINFLVMPMFFLSGAMFPVKTLPPLFHALTLANPLTYGVDALKHLLLTPQADSLFQPEFSLGIDLLFLGGFTLAVVGYAVFRFNRQHV